MRDAWQKGFAMTRGSLGVILVLLLASVCARGAPGQTPAPSPLPAATPVAPGAFACPVQVLDVVSLDAPSDATNSTTLPSAKKYAFGIQAFQVDPAEVSGTLTVYSDSAKYEIPFKDAVAEGSTAGSLPKIVPVVARFPEPVSIRAAYVEWLDGPNAGPCEAAGAWVWSPPPVRPPADSPLPHPSPPAVDIKGYITHGAALAAPVDISKVIPLKAATCDAPFAPARLVRGAQADTPLVARDEAHQGQVWVEVVLTPTGAIATQWVWESSGYSELDQESLRAAKASTYAPTRLGCKPAAGAYMFIVQLSRF